MKNSKAETASNNTLLVRGPFSDYLFPVADPATRRYSSDVSSFSEVWDQHLGVDQASGAECDVNNVILRYSHTGQLPLRANHAQAFYDDVSEVPDLLTALQMVKDANYALAAATAASQAARSTNPDPEAPAAPTPSPAPES